MTTLRTHSISDYDDKAALTTIGGSDRPRVNVFVAQTGLSVDPFQKEGTNTIGRAISIPDFTKDIDYETIQAGAVKGHQYSIPLTSSRSMQFTFDKLKLVALWLATGSDIALEPKYGASGQTTITGTSRNSGTVAAATGLAKKNLVIVDTRHATFSGFLEATFISAISGTTVTLDPPLDHIPSAGTTFKKVAGKADGTGASDMGVIIHDAVDVVIPRVMLIIEEFFPGNFSKFVRWFPEVEVLPGGTSASGNMKTASLTFKPIQQAEATFTLMDGTTEARPYYGKGHWVPVN